MEPPEPGTYSEFRMKQIRLAAVIMVSAENGDPPDVDDKAHIDRWAERLTDLLDSLTDTSQN